MEHQRELFRIALERQGEIRRGDVTQVFDIIDLTEKGLQFKTSLPVEVGETFQIQFELEPASIIHCTILTTRVSLPHVGARIIDISPDDQTRLSHFIEEFIALNLGGF